MKFIHPSQRKFWQISGYVLSVFLMICLACSHASAQLPNPKLYMSLDYANFLYDEVSKTTGTYTGSITARTDRFGKAGGAVRLQGAGTNIKPPNIGIPASYTVSYWTYINDPSTIPPGPTPFTTTDIHKEVFGVYSLTTGNNNPNDVRAKNTNRPDASSSRGGTATNTKLEGMARVKATIGIDRFIAKADGPKVPWYLWSYAPVQFDQSGWYHIIYVHDVNYNKIYMIKPDNTKFCSYNYLGVQTVEGFLFVLGAANNSFTPIDYLDDFKLFDVSFTENQVDMLHNVEKVSNPNVTQVYRLKNVKSGLYLTADYGVDTNTDEDAMLKSENDAGATLLWKIYNMNATAASPQQIRWLSELGKQKGLNLYRGRTGDNSQVGTYGVTDDWNNLWIFTRLSNGNYNIKVNNAANLYLGADNGGTRSNTLVKTRTSIQSDQSTEWTVEEVDLRTNFNGKYGGYYRFKNKNSGFYFL